MFCHPISVYILHYKYCYKNIILLLFHSFFVYRYTDKKNIIIQHTQYKLSSSSFSPLTTLPVLCDLWDMIFKSKVYMRVCVTVLSVCVSETMCGSSCVNIMFNIMSIFLWQQHSGIVLVVVVCVV